MSKIARDRRLALLHDRVDRLQVGRAGEVLLDRLDDVVAHLGDRGAVVLTEIVTVGWLTSGKSSLTIVAVERMPANIINATITKTSVGRLTKSRVRLNFTVERDLLAVADARLAVADDARSRRDARRRPRSCRRCRVR